MSDFVFVLLFLVVFVESHFPFEVRAVAQRTVRATSTGKLATFARSDDTTACVTFVLHLCYICVTFVSQLCYI